MNAASAKLTLRQFAWQKAGVLEFFITFTINFVIAIGVFWPAQSLPLIGGYSLLSMLGPMCFILPLASSFFGVANAARVRSQGIVDIPWPNDAPWQRYGLQIGFVRGVCSSVFTIVMLWITASILGNLLLPKWLCVVGIGLLSGILGYAYHSTAIMATAIRFPAAPSPLSRG